MEFTLPMTQVVPLQDVFIIFRKTTISSVWQIADSVRCRKVGAQKMATKAVDEAILDAETNNGDGACEDCPYVTHDAGCPPAGCVHHVW